MVQPGIQKITNPDPGKTYPGSGNKPILDLGSGKTPIPDPGYKKKAYPGSRGQKGTVS